MCMYVLQADSLFELTHFNNHYYNFVGSGVRNVHCRFPRFLVATTSKVFNNDIVIMLFSCVQLEPGALRGRIPYIY